MAAKNDTGGEPCPRCKFKKLVPIKDRGTIRFTPIEKLD